MKAKFLNFLIALALSLPTAMVVSMSTAEAGPGDTIRSANKDGKRTHKRANAKRTKKKSSKKATTTRRSSSNRRHVTRTTTHRHSPQRTVRRTTTRTRHVRSAPRRTVRRTTVHHNHARRTRHVHHRTHTRTVHHHHSSTSASTSASTTRRATGRAKNESSIEAYLTGGLGYSGFAAPTITDEALPGAGYNLALGVKGEYIGFEFGFNGSGHTFDPAAGTTDLAVLGLSADLKVQPSFGPFEPYALAGVGGYSLQDGVVNEASGGGAIRLGLGADFRFDDAALGVRYLHSTYGFADDSGIYGGDFGATSETLGVNLSVYF